VRTTRLPEMLKAVVRMHENTAGIYGAVTRVGRVEVGQRVFVGAPSEVGERGLTEAYTPQLVDRPVQRLEEARTVTCVERRRPARIQPGAA